VKTEKDCYVCVRGRSEDPTGEMDAGTMYLRGLLHGLHLSRPETAMGTLLHGDVLCEKYKRRAGAIAHALMVTSTAAKQRAGGLKS
jgi:hypothetical protein